MAGHPHSGPGDGPPVRVHITGGSGSGKTTLARLVAAELGVTAWHLDDVARVAGGNTPERPIEERLATVERIVAGPRWVTEGIDLDWTEGLLVAADAIVWLDTVSWSLASRRIVRRFVADALAEARRRKGRERVLRVRDYARHTVELIRAIPETRRYHADASGQAGADTGASAVSHAATETALSPYADKLIRCRTGTDVDAFMATLRSSAEAPGPQ